LRLKVSRTIADLEGKANVLLHFISENNSYRGRDREWWGA